MRLLEAPLKFVSTNVCLRGAGVNNAFSESTRMPIGYDYCSCFSEPLAVRPSPHQSLLREGRMAIEVPAAVPPLQPRPVTTPLNPRISTNAGPPGRRRAPPNDRAVRRKIAVAAPILISVAVVIIYTLLGR